MLVKAELNYVPTVRAKLLDLTTTQLSFIETDIA